MLEPSWVGRRVSVRRVVERASDGRLLHGDVVGDLEDVDTQTALVRSRNGVVEIPVALITAARLAPPSTFDELALEAVAAQGWRPAQTAMLGGWLLRADAGFTARANSVLPLRSPGVPLDEALADAGAWYAERGLSLRIATLPEARRLLDAELAERGWPVSGAAHVLAARLDRVRRLPAPDPRIVVAPTASDEWFALYRGGAGADGVARALLSRHDRVAFAALPDADGSLLAIGRGVVDDGWLGISAVEVAPAARRRGLATAIMDALCRWGESQGAARSYLQVNADNDVAIGMYEQRGYWMHHDYWYRSPPS